MMKHFRLRTILLLLAVLGICLPSVVISVSLTHQYKQRMLQDYISYVNNELVRIADSIDNYLNANILAISEALLYDAEFHTLLNADLPAGETPEALRWEYMAREYLLNRHLEGMANYGVMDMHLAHLMNERGECFNLAYPIQVLGRDNPWVSGLCKNEDDWTIRFHWYPPVENPLESPYAGSRSNMVIPVTRNIISPLTQKLYGKQIFLLPEEQLFALYNASELAKNSRIWLIDEQGRKISCSDLTAWNQESPPPPGLDDRQKTYTGRSAIGVNGWTLMCEASLATIEEGVGRKAAQDAIWIGGLLAVICLVVTFAANAITGPLYTLMASMSRASHKDFSGHIPEQGTKDVSRLIGNYNSLLSDVDDLIYREYEVSRQKQQAEMDALVTQINPHFLYNTLESIVWQARAAGVPRVADMAHYLGELFNLTVNKGKPMMSIEKELQHVQMYVNLQNMRYNDRIRLKISWDDEALLACRTLKLILQPVVENSILHGMPPAEGILTIYIHVEQEGDGLVFYVEDDGNGIEPEQLCSLVRKLEDPSVMYDREGAEREKCQGNGIGIVNVHQRLRLYYGNRYGVTIQSSLGQGTCTEIRIPVQPV